MPFSATAEGSASGETCSLTEACHDGPNSAMPVPTMKQNSRRMFGVIRLRKVRIDSVVAPASAMESPISETSRRSYMSAIAPAAIEISIVGSIAAVCTSATLSADEVIRVIAQAAPTPCTSMPKFDNRLASQIRRNTGSRSGAPMPSPERRVGVEASWSISFTNRPTNLLVLFGKPIASRQLQIRVTYWLCKARPCLTPGRRLRTIQNVLDNVGRCQACRKFRVKIGGFPAARPCFVAWTVDHDGLARARRLLGRLGSDARARARRGGVRRLPAERRCATPAARIDRHRDPDSADRARPFRRAALY